MPDPVAEILTGELAKHRWYAELGPMCACGAGPFMRSLAHEAHVGEVLSRALGVEVFATVATGYPGEHLRGVNTYRIRALDALPESEG